MTAKPAERPPDLASATAIVVEMDAMLRDSRGFWFEVNEDERGHAAHLAQRMTATDWPVLYAVWRQRPIEWQRYLATVLASVAPPKAVAWLLEMIELGDDELGMHAIDELRNLQAEHSLVLPWPASTVARVKVLWRRHRGFTAGQLDQFLADLAHGGVIGR